MQHDALEAQALDNLYVTDASFFPSIGAVNPTPTIVANALRVTDRIKHRLGCDAAAFPWANIRVA